MEENYRLIYEQHSGRFDVTSYQLLCHSEEQSDVGISSNALEIRKMMLNIENPKCTMLIGADGIDKLVLEIATSPP